MKLLLIICAGENNNKVLPDEGNLEVSCSRPRPKFFDPPQLQPDRGGNYIA